jgi:hypothetical protein
MYFGMPNHICVKLQGYLMPKVWLCPIAVGERDDANHCLHCIYLTPPEDCDKDHKTLFVWCDNRLKRVFVRDSSDNEENGNNNNNKSGRPYRPIGWYCSRCDKVITSKEYHELEAERQRHEQTYKQRKDEYNQLWLKHLDGWWDWVFKERERIGWTFVEKEDPSDYDDDSDAGITWGWLPDSKLTPEQRRRARRPYTDNYFRPRA